MDFSGISQPYDPPDYQRDQVLGNATLPESDVLAQDASDTFFGMERQAGAYLASQVASTPLAALRGPGQDEYIDAHTLNQDYGQPLGLSFSQPMRRAQADILVQQKRDQLSRDYTLSHAPGGFWNGTANFTTQLAVSAVDPANVAAAFVPVVGEARAGLWAQKIGTTAARVAEGGVEGAAGMAALQPVQYAYSNEFQQEYGPMDAFMQVAFGGLLGGGLHVGAGAISDMLGGLHPETREAALRGSVAQMAEGRPVDATAALASDPSFEASAASPDAVPETAAPGVAAPPGPLPGRPSEDDLSDAMATVREARSPMPKEPSVLDTVRSLGGIALKNASGEPTQGASEIRAALKDYKRPGVINSKGGKAPDYMREALAEQGWLPQDSDLNDLYDLLGREAQGEKVYHPDSTIHGMLEYRAVLDRELGEAGVAHSDSHEVAAQKLAEFRARERQEPIFQSHEQEDIASGEDQLSPHAQEVLHSDDDWIGSDEWFRQESAGFDSSGDATAPEGVPEIGANAGLEPAGPGRGAASRGAATGVGEVRPEFDDALNRASTAQNDFTQNREASTLVPPGVSEAAARDVASGKGDNIDEEIEEAERTLADYQRNGVISEDDLAAMKEANAADAEAAKTQGEAAKAASTCLWLHP